VTVVDINSASQMHIRAAHLSSERGMALIVALMAMLFMTALGTTLILTTSVESKITRNFANGAAALYAADAMLERTVAELSSIHDWDGVLSGAIQSAFADGSRGGRRVLADGQPIDLGEIVNLANCRKTAACSDADMVNSNADRPWGSNNPRWQLFAWGALDDMMPNGTISSPFYVTVLIADDGSENDGDPLRDGRVACEQGQVMECNPGTGVIALRAEAFGPFGTHKILELAVARTDLTGREEDYNVGSRPVGIRILSWREVR
jgi:hypothetical protein